MSIKRLIHTLKCVSKRMMFQMILAIFVAVSVAQVVSWAALSQAYHTNLNSLNQTAYIQKIVSLVTLLENNPTTTYPIIAEAASIRNTHFSIEATSRLAAAAAPYLGN